MPLYSYKCDRCGWKFDKFSTIKARNNPKKCPKCKNFTGKRDRETEFARKGRFNELDAEHPRWSWALGVHPADIPEAIKVHPGAVFDEKGRMLIRNRKEKLQRLKEAKMVELD